MFNLIFELRFDEKQVTEPLQPEPVICVTRPELAFRLLRNFGHLILNLNLEYIQFNYQRNFKSVKGYTMPEDYAEEYVQFDYQRKLNSVNGHTMIEDYLAEYCSETLCQLSLQYFDIYHRFDVCFFHNVQKQFSRVKTLHIIHCNSYKDLPLNIIFPSLETLKWEYNLCRSESTLITHFHSLKSVEIVFPSEFKDEDIEEFFQLNQKLESAKICFTRNLTPNLYPRLKFYCPNIKNYYTGSNLNRGPFYLYKFINPGRYCRDKNKMYPLNTSQRYKNDLQALYFLYKKVMR